MPEKNQCSCCAAPTLIFACSGSSDVGGMADQAARKLTRDGAGKMFCLAGIGGRVSGIMKTTESAGRILVIDGCPQACAKKTMENAGFKNFAHLQLGELGMEKGQSPATDYRISQVVEKAETMLKAMCS